MDEIKPVAWRARFKNAPELGDWFSAEPIDGDLNETEPLYDKQAIDTLTAEVERLRKAVAWLRGDDTGRSSEAICLHMLGGFSDGSFPYDPADLGRCLRLLALFPEWSERIGEMGRYSAEWAALGQRWAHLAAMMEREVGIDGRKGRSAPDTYAAMKKVLHAATQEVK